MSQDVHLPKEYVIQGTTHSGATFRPSDWAERLCGIMSGFRPGGGKVTAQMHLGYSPYVKPVMISGVKCVVFDERLKEIEPMAFDFLFNFASDNQLPVTDVCVVPERAPSKK